jgi:hypothetical protein
MRHGFHTYDLHRIANTGGHHQTRMTQSNTTGCTRPFHFGTGNAMQTQLLSHQTGQHLFAVQRAADEITEVNRAYARAIYAGLDDGLRASVDRQRLDAAACVLAESG